MKHIPSLLFLLTALPLLSQELTKPIFCGNEIFSDMVRNHYPDLQEALSTTFENAKLSSHNRNNEPLNVRVVVHVVWNDPAENLDDSIIYDQIRILNEDYNRLNADTAGLRSIFQNDAGAANIHFELEEIVRVQTESLFSINLLGTNILSEVKHDVDGGSDAWNTEEYMNIWITKIQPIQIFGIVIGQILGFAFPPNGLDHWPAGVAAPTPQEDGVVLDYRIIGSNNPNTIEEPSSGNVLTIKGRTATHEIGHYLGLRHIWGDGGLLGPNDCAQSDGIDDTPYADSQSAFDCDKTKNTCPQIEVHYNENMPDLIENFMDYSSDDCMNMFSKGQAQLMRNVLLGPRSGLIDPVSVSTEAALIESPSFTLAPNPADGRTTIYFEVTHNTEITIRLSDIGGHLTLVHVNQNYSPGKHDLGMDLNGFSPGIYFIELRTSNAVSVRKLILN